MTDARSVLAEQRRRLHATAVAEHVDTADLDDPHGDQARGIDPDAYREDHHL